MIDRLLQFSLTQRLLVVLATCVIVALGIVSWQQLPLDAVPDLTPNQVEINTATGGMSPEEVERLVTFPVETAMGGLPGLQMTRSLSQYGLSKVTVVFGDNVDIYFARQLVGERLGQVRQTLPLDVGTPQLGPVSTGLGEIYFFAIESAGRSPMDLRTMLDWTIDPQIRTVPGVAEINVMDGSEKQFQVLVDPQALIARGLSVAEVAGALQRNNRNAGGGVVEVNGERLPVRSIGMATDKTDIERIVVATSNGAPILIRDVASVTEGVPVLTGFSTKDGMETVVASVMMLQGANARTVARAVDERVNEIRRQLPPDVKLTTVYNRAVLVNKTIETVSHSLLAGGALVIVVLLLLLGNLRGALIVATAIPLSMLVAVVCMNRFGVSGNLMSLGAIDFGLIVDGAVVMIENAVRRLAEQRSEQRRTLNREEVRRTVWEASQEVAKPTAFAVAIITAVYLPILALEGIEGKTFKPMAFTVVFALTGALALTLTLVPALASIFLSGDTREGRNPVMLFFARLYEPTLLFALKRPVPVVAVAVLMLVGAGILFTTLGTQFVPVLDEGSLDIHPIRMRSIGLEESMRLIRADERKILELPQVTSVFSRTGTSEIANDPMPLSFGDMYVMLKPYEEWDPRIGKPELIARMQKKLAEVPGQSYEISQPIQERFDELSTGVRADVAVKVFGDDLGVLRSKAAEVARVLEAVPGAQDVQVEQVDNIPVLQITIDRDAIARYGVSVDDIQQLVSTLLGGDPVGEIVQGDRRFALTMRLPESVRNDASEIGRLPVKTPEGGSVPLRALARIDTVPAPAQISRDMGHRRVVVQCNVRGRDLGSFIVAARRAVNRQISLPEGNHLEWGGQFENLQRASQRLMIVVPAALGLIFVLLFMTFGSVRQALLIFSGVPLAVTGGVFALWARGLPFSITAGVGFIALSGVAVLNGVVMVSAINRLRDQEMELHTAVREGATQRLRPVLMTALVAALGFVPMALNTGIGAEVQRPLATVVIGGILSSTLLTLVALPVLYTWFESRTRDVMGREAAGTRAVP